MLQFPNTKTVSSPSVTTLVIKIKCTTYITSALFAHTVRLKTDTFLLSIRPSVRRAGGLRRAVDALEPGYARPVPDGFPCRSGGDDDGRETKRLLTVPPRG